MMGIKEWLNSELDARGLNVNQLSRISKVPQPTIFRILSGETKDPRSDTVAKLARALGMSSELIKAVPATAIPLMAPAVVYGHSDPQTADALQALHAKTRRLRPAIRDAAITLIAAYLSADDDQEQIADAIRHLIGDSP